MAKYSSLVLITPEIENLKKIIKRMKQQRETATKKSIRKEVNNK